MLLPTIVLQFAEGTRLSIYMAAGMTIFLVEQNANQALKRSDVAHVLETGEIVKSGTGPALAVDPAVKAAYLGGDV